METRTVFDKEMSGRPKTSNGKDRLCKTNLCAFPYNVYLYYYQIVYNYYIQQCTKCDTYRYSSQGKKSLRKLTYWGELWGWNVPGASLF